MRARELQRCMCTAFEVNPIPIRLGKTENNSSYIFCITLSDVIRELLFHFILFFTVFSQSSGRVH